MDSNGVHREAWIAFNARHGIATTEDMIGRMYGKRNDEIVRDFFGPHLTPEENFAHGVSKEALYREIMAPRLESSLVPGIREFLTTYRHLPAAVATNGEAANADLVLRSTRLLPYFRFVVDGHQVQHAKPHPEIYLLAAKLLGVEPVECVVFEDSYAGVAAGRAAGMTVVGIQTTHADLPGTAVAVTDFADPRLFRWLDSQGLNP